MSEAEEILAWQARGVAAVEQEAIAEGQIETAHVCGFCLRKLKKKLADPPRKLHSQSTPCDKCPKYYAKSVVRIKH